MTQVLVVALALTAALCAAIGIVVRQLATQHVPAEHGMSPVMVSALMRNKLWWAGTGSAVAGYIFQALALTFGSLLMVQPLLVSSLLFALPLSARAAHQRVTRAEWGWAILLTVGLAVFVLVGHPREGHFQPTPQVWLGVAAVCLPLIVGCIIGAVRTLATPRAVLLAVAVGVMFGLVALLTKLCTHRFHTGGPVAVLTSPALYLLVLVAIVGTVLQQSAFHADSLQTSVPTMLVLEPVVAVLLGVLVLGEELTVHGLPVVLLPIAVAAMLAGTIALGRDTGARDEQIAHAGAPAP
ncbi:MAG TPA: DMT family transporter [Mycobacterium sp.]|nr:DMT family transporter [Mycobacterium sp.]